MITSERSRRTGAWAWAVVTAAVLGVWVTVWLLGPTPAAGPPAIASRRSEVNEELESALTALEQRLAALERGRGGAPAQPFVRTPAAQGDDHLRALVAELVEEALAARAARATLEPGPRDLDAALRELADPALDPDRRQELLGELARAGRLEAAIEELEEQAALYPAEASVHLALAEAYIERIQEVRDGELAGELAQMADAAFDRALGLDPANVEARFAKAHALTYWPPESGKHQEAIEHLQLLLQQQTHGPSPHHVKAHLLLGQTWLKIGDMEAAKAAWLQGLAHNPDDEALRSQLELRGWL